MKFDQNKQREIISQNNSKLSVRIYMDHMASTPVDRRVLKVMEPFWSDIYGHPWASHEDGRNAGAAIKEAQRSIASNIGAKEKEIVFTGTGTEASAQALRGYIDQLEIDSGNLKDLHIIVSGMEHPSVGGVILYAKSKGMHVDILDVDENGLIKVGEFRDKLRDDTVLVSVVLASSEIGTIQPISEIGKILKNHKAVLHTDASQGALYFDLNVDSLGVDMMTIDAHKMYGPKGIGALYVREGIKLMPLFFGNEGKSYVRHGTPATGFIVGFAKTFDIAKDEREEMKKQVTSVRDYLIDRVLKEIPLSRLNGSRDKRIPHNASFSFEGANHEFVATILDEKGISVATRSACFSGEGGESNVIKALFDHRQSSAIRFSIGKETTKENIDYVVKSLKESLSLS